MESKSYKFGLNFWGIALIILVIFQLIFLLYLLIKSKKSMIAKGSNLAQDQEQDQEQDQDQNNPVLEFYKRVVIAAPELDDRMKAYITAQAMHETGIFTSPLFLKYNNAFGMKMPVQRHTLATQPTPTGYATYNSVEDSIKDLVLYFSAKEYPETFETVGEYVDFAKTKGYFEASLASYKKAVTKYLNEVNTFAQ